MQRAHIRNIELAQTNAGQAMIYADVFRSSIDNTACTGRMNVVMEQKFLFFQSKFFHLQICLFAKLYNLTVKRAIV